MKFYFVVPFCNGEIIDFPYIVKCLCDIHDYECLVYEISFDINIEEVGN